MIVHIWGLFGGGTKEGLIILIIPEGIDKT
jgi:hypothetical protein